jgi:predicted O-methyltransferase YrrM
MKGTTIQKVGRLVKNLALHPRYLPRYVEHSARSLVQHRTPLDLEIPWMSYAAIDFLDGHLRTHMTAFEYGSGGSTLFLAKRVRSVFSVEDNAMWFDLVSRRLAERGFSNVTMKLHPFDVENPTGFETSDYLRALPEEAFDVVIIDGSEAWTQVRPTCFSYVEGRMKPGGIIVLDDSWRYVAPRLHNKAKRFEIYESAGPCRPGCTTTDIFFY